ncbi:flavin-containing monooxygenase [Sphingomonas crocodyli]|uniref:flavin-containing monooxygenase n=1 Tax=Sphingomonas crocodyli TaxID=1979270 RepID=UPI00267A9745
MESLSGRALRRRKLRLFLLSPEIDQEWTWTERYAAQPEILRYAHFVADRLGVRPYFTFNMAMVGADYDEAVARWTIRTDKGDSLTAQFVVMATGCLAVPKDPAIPGLGDFAGETYFTSRWPHEDVSFAGKRVGVIGTGSSGIQAITAVAEKAGELFVFQRTPTFSVPARNAPISPEKMDEAKAIYPDRRRDARASYAGLKATPGTRKTFEMNDEERRANFDQAWARGGFSMLGAFPDHMMTIEANDQVADYVRGEINVIVEDQAVAEALKPRGYPIGSRRVALDTGYHAVYNKPNVHLVDLKVDPIRDVTAEGVRTESATYPLDMLILATGFDAFTGALSSVDIYGRDGRLLRDVWAQSADCFLGMAVHGFPNMFMITGPSGPTAISNVIATIEANVEWLVRAFTYARDHDIEALEANADAQSAWAAKVAGLAENSLYMRGNSWYMGANIPGKPVQFMCYLGGLPSYRQICDQVIDAGFEGAFDVTYKAPAEMA